MAKNRLWIQRAVEKKGALRRDVKRDFGDKGFTKKGSIKSSVLTKLSKEKTESGKTTTTARRARLAITLKRLRKRRK